MSIRDNITNDLKKAIISKNTTLVNTLRLIKAAIQEKDIIAKGNGKLDISNQEIISILKSMIKQRNLSKDLYLKADRMDLFNKEENEIKIISKLLPEQLTTEEIEKIVNNAIKSSKASSIKDMGKIISIMKNQYNGMIDFSIASKLIKDKLSQDIK